MKNVRYLYFTTIPVNDFLIFSANPLQGSIALLRRSRPITPHPMKGGVGGEDEAGTPPCFAGELPRAFQT